MLVQKSTTVEKGDTPETLKAKVQALEGPSLIDAVEALRDGDAGARASRRGPA